MATKYNVSLNDIHFALHKCRFNRVLTANRLNVSLYYLQKRIKNDLLPIPNKMITRFN